MKGVKVGLTGSIGMGKSTTAKMFRDAGCSVWDADEAVARLYAPGGSGAQGIAATFRDVIDDDGSVSRDRLRALVTNDPSALDVIERIVHPLVAEDRRIWSQNADAPIQVYDIPLLFETGSNAEMDTTVCVYVDAETQRRRVLDRGTMTEAQFDVILAAQLPISEKRALCDYEIETRALAKTREQVARVLADIKERFDA